MTVVVTGASGFLGQRLVRALLARGTVGGPDGAQAPIGRIVMLDVSAPAGFDDPRIDIQVGDLADEAVVRRAIAHDTASVFHLAAVVSGQAEADFELGMRVNLDAARLLLEACRALGSVPRVMFTSSVAVYGGDLPALVDDRTPLDPQSSYGMQKAVAEMLLNDYARKGFVDGRVARLPTISVRPGRPNAAASSFASGIIREPLNREPAVCPVPPESRLWLLSPRKAIECLVALHDIPAAALGRARKVNLPGVSINVGEMVQTLARVAGPEYADYVRWERNPAIERIVCSWPAAWDVSRATELGLAGDADFAAIVRAYIEDDLHPTPAAAGRA
ncbi:MAG: SDR family oxidoreductase [Proteobacteria bacterium]|nr:SDR family oxidoreductase [Pseudomonadota bacterium]